MSTFYINVAHSKFRMNLDCVKSAVKS